MRPSRAVAVGLASALLPIVAGCGTVIVPFTPPSSTSPLTADWNFAGDRALKSYPVLNATLLVDGSRITAPGDMSVQCANGGSGAGSSFGLTGQIAADGSFHLTRPAGAPASGVLLSIDGTAPTGNQSTWSGTYTLTDAPGFTGCLINQTGPFTATQFAPLNNAVYEGPVSSQFGTLNIAVTLSQGTPVTQPNDPYLPVTGSIAVSGSSCFSRGTSSGAPQDQIDGDLSSLRFNMDDGSHIDFTGTFGSPDESTMNPTIIGVFGGQCNGHAYEGTLTRR